MSAFNFNMAIWILIMLKFYFFFFHLVWGGLACGLENSVFNIL